MISLLCCTQDSGRQPSENGEVNLLREETKRFANMVQCVAEIDNEGNY